VHDDDDRQNTRISLKMANSNYLLFREQMFFSRRRTQGDLSKRVSNSFLHIFLNYLIRRVNI